MNSINLSKKREIFEEDNDPYKLYNSTMIDFYPILVIFFIIIPSLFIYNYGLVWGIIISLNVIIYIFVIFLSLIRLGSGAGKNSFESDPKGTLGFFTCIFFIFTLIPTFLARKFT